MRVELRRSAMFCLACSLGTRAPVSAAPGAETAGWRVYRNDRYFMRAVDRYIGEFERLLEEVSRDDRGQVVARTYLTSETGKVYTMLAHAAGRFE